MDGAPYANAEAIDDGDDARNESGGARGDGDGGCEAPCTKDEDGPQDRSAAASNIIDEGDEGAASCNYEDANTSYGVKRSDDENARSSSSTSVSNDDARTTSCRNAADSRNCSSISYGTGTRIGTRDDDGSMEGGTSNRRPNASSKAARGAGDDAGGRSRESPDTRRRGIPREGRGTDERG